MKPVRKWFTCTPADASLLDQAAAVERCSTAQLMRNAALAKAEQVLAAKRGAGE